MNTALTIGNFDGVHRGHAQLVKGLSEWRKSLEENSPSRCLALTFEPHPRNILCPDMPVSRLCDPNEKSQRLKQLGVDDVIIWKFDRDYSETSASEFFSQLQSQFNPSLITVGFNFHFGKNREGKPEKLLEWGREKGIDVQIVRPIEGDGELISSSRIRQLLEEGNIATANRLLGRDYSLSNRVVQGDRRGHLLGFPTANLEIPRVHGSSQCTPKPGVYITSTTLENGEVHPSVTNIGVKPTVSSEGKRLIESHILNFSGDLYGKWLTVEFRDRLRDERRFGSIDELKEQIQEDSQIARKRLGLI